MGLVKEAYISKAFAPGEKPMITHKLIPLKHSKQHRDSSFSQYLPGRETGQGFFSRQPLLIAFITLGMGIVNLVSFSMLGLLKFLCFLSFMNLPHHFSKESFTLKEIAY